MRHVADRSRRCALALLGLLTIGLGCSAPPRVSAGAVTVHARFVTPASASIAPTGPWSTVLDVEIGVTANGDGADYELEAYPYVGGAAPAVLDFGQGFDAAGRVIGGAGITTGRNGATLEIAHQVLTDRGLNVQTDWPGEGIALAPTVRAARVRFGIPATPAALAVRPDQLLVVVVYTERRAGGDVHWSKAYPVPASLDMAGP